MTTARLRRLVKGWQGTVSDATINRRLSLLRRAYALGKLRLDPAVLDFTDLALVENSPLGKHIDAPAFETSMRSCRRAGSRSSSSATSPASARVR